MTPEERARRVELQRAEARALRIEMQRECARLRRNFDASRDWDFDFIGSMHDGGQRRQSHRRQAMKERTGLINMRRIAAINLQKIARHVP